ncbi:hypothetical protein GGD72_000893 [Stenotrophomonas maltophilia]|nr:hypothetical protein [Stenotrophomonas maltophilia]
MHPVIKLIADFAQLFSDITTVALGAAAAIGFYTQRKKISLIFRLYLNNHFNQRAKKMHEVISRLKELNYNEKSQKAEVMQCIHALIGQIRPWCGQKSSLAPLLIRLEEISSKRQRLTEGLKTELAHELEETLESMFMNDVTATDASGGGLHD